MKKLLLSVAIIATSFTSIAQVGVGTTNPDASAALDVESTTKGFLPPRMTLQQMEAITSPAIGLMMYCTNCPTKGLYTYSGIEFLSVINGVSTDVAKTAEVVSLVSDANDPADGTPSVANITALGVTGALSANQALYEVAIFNAQPKNLTDLQNLITELNAVQAIVNGSNDPADGTPSIADLVAVGVIGTVPGNEAAYEVEIANTTPAPTTLAELQLIIDYVNNPIPAIVANSNYPAGNITESQLTNAGVTGTVTANVPAYEADIALASPQPTDLAGVQAIVDAVNAFVTANAADVVVSNTGKIWMNKNLGATQVATSSSDVASYGNHYQWGKAQAFTSAYNTANNVAGPVADAATAGTAFVTSSSDWLSTPNNVLWNSGTSSKPVKVVANDPCPANYRIPTETELNTERLDWVINNPTNKTNDTAGAFDSKLKLPAPGYRSYVNGALTNPGTHGHYWSSNTSGANALFLNFNTSNGLMSSNRRAFGFSVRCVKE
mgnify:CR=1 FL=1